MPKTPGNSVLVHAYKHNGSLYRVWDKAIVFEDNEEYLILVNEEVFVTEINGRKWRTNEPAIWFFPKNYWFNVICMFKDKGINYYCNIASPCIMEAQTVKYIDYDLDIKLFNDYSYKILDLKEFNRNRIAFNYSRNLVELIWQQVDELKKMIKDREGMFDHDFATETFERYTKNYKSRHKLKHK